MADIAKSAGLAKGTSYLYFDSKESLQLAVLEEELTLFFLEVEHQLRTRPPGDDRARAAAEIIAKALTDLPALLPLLQTLHSDLERKLSYLDLLRFKRFLLERLVTTGRSLERFVGLSSGAGEVALLRAHALAIGFAQMTDRSSVLERVLQSNAELTPLDFGFHEAYVAALCDQLRALTQI